MRTDKTFEETESGYNENSKTNLLLKHKANLVEMKIEDNIWS